MYESCQLLLTVAKRILIFRSFVLSFRFCFFFGRGRLCFNCLSPSGQLPATPSEQPIDEPEDQCQDRNREEEHQWGEETESPHRETTGSKTPLEVASRALVEIMHGHSPWTR